MCTAIYSNERKYQQPSIGIYYSNPSSTDKIAKSHVTTGAQACDQPKNQQFILVTIYINACTQINVYFHFRKVEFNLLSLKAVDTFKYALLLMDALFNDHEMSTCYLQQAERGAASAKSPLSPRRVKLLEGKIKYRYAHIQNQTYIMYADRTFVHLYMYIWTADVHRAWHTNQGQMQSKV